MPNVTEKKNGKYHKDRRLQAGNQSE
jgi:hypothetical protein